MILRTVCLAAMLAAAACSPAPESDPAAPATGEAPAAKRMPLPDCGGIEAQDAGADGWKHPDCRLMLPDTSGLAIEARYIPAEDESTEVKVQVVQTGDATIQEIVERMGNTFNGPNLEDFDKDGKTDILLPLETGNVNTTWAAWRQLDAGKFVRVGEPSGVSIVKTASGYIATAARSSANEWSISFYKLEGDALEPIATADITAEGEPDKITGTTCDVTDDGGVAAAGLTVDTAKAQFCAESVVTEIFK